MVSENIYKDISARCGGDVYIGVVGPVRSGKSTFITNFMNQLVIPAIENLGDKKRAIDELPQSADGTEIMTTSPRFVPNNAVSCSVAKNIKFNVRMVDCVGYVVEGATGILSADGTARMVKTPWSNKELTFEKAAEIGTKKVITEHSTIAIALTNDGSIGEISRESFKLAEEKVVRQLKAINKPFVLVVNTLHPNTQSSTDLRHELAYKYGCKVLSCNVKNLNKEDINNIMEAVLEEFPITSFKINMPKWLQVLDFNNEIITEVLNEVRSITNNAEKIAKVDVNQTFNGSKNFLPFKVDSIDAATGIATFSVIPHNDLYFKVLSIQSGQSITSDFELVAYLKTLSVAKVEHDKLKAALDEVRETGYGVVIPQANDLILEEPQIFKSGSKNGVRLRATAPSLHIMRVDVATEVSPTIGTEQQSEEMLKYLQSEFENNKAKLWETNIFGKSLHTLVNEGINSKVSGMPVEAQKKIRKTVGKIVNDGKGGIICILL
ncbi:MAG: stage IV sporulation protein A [Firmicutes bacterium]|nr:stage IV sporulation protein A [Bacillota bacterium]